MRFHLVSLLVVLAATLSIAQLVPVDEAEALVLQFDQSSAQAAPADDVNVIDVSLQQDQQQQQQQEEGATTRSSLVGCTPSVVLATLVAFFGGCFVVLLVATIMQYRLLHNTNSMYTPIDGEGKAAHNGLR
jgi:hypothetical protein